MDESKGSRMMIFCVSFIWWPASSKQQVKEPYLTRERISREVSFYSPITFSSTIGYFNGFRLVRNLVNDDLLCLLYLVTCFGKITSRECIPDARTNIKRGKIFIPLCFMVTFSISVLPGYRDKTREVSFLFPWSLTIAFQRNIPTLAIGWYHAYTSVLVEARQVFHFPILMDVNN